MLSWGSEELFRPVRDSGACAVKKSVPRVSCRGEEYGSQAYRPVALESSNAGRLCGTVGMSSCTCGAL